MNSRRKSGGSPKQRLEYAQARRLGLKSYGKFKVSLLPELKRVSPAQRKSLMEKIYALAARKVRIEDDKNTEQVAAERLRPDRRKLVQTRQHVQNAVNELTSADRISPDGPYPWSGSSEMIAELKLRVANIKTWENFCADLVHPQLRSPAETKSASLSEEKYPKFPVGLTKKDSDINFGFISAVEQLLPNVALRGGIVDAARSKIISQVFAAAFGQSGYTPRRITKIRERLRKKPLPRNPFLASQID